MVEMHGLTQFHYSQLLPPNLAHKRCKVLLHNEDPFAEAKSNLTKSLTYSPPPSLSYKSCPEFQLALQNMSLLSCLTLLQKSLLFPPIPALVPSLMMMYGCPFPRRCCGEGVKHVTPPACVSTANYKPCQSKLMQSCNPL